MKKILRNVPSLYSKWKSTWNSNEEVPEKLDSRYLNQLILSSKRKLLVLSLIGVVGIGLSSLFALNYHNKIRSYEQSFRILNTTLSKQMNLMGQILAVCERVAGGRISHATVQELKMLADEFGKERAFLTNWLERSKLLNSRKIRDLLAGYDFTDKFEEHLAKLDELITTRPLESQKFAAELALLLSHSREGLMKAFTEINDEVSHQYHVFGRERDEAGYFLVFLSLAQLFLFWLIIFRPLNKMLLDKNRKLGMALVKATQADEAKTNFLANISHEIRTPMTAILGYIELLKNDQIDDEKKRQFVETIDHNSSHLLALINELLDLGKVEAGKFEFNYQSVNIQKTLSEVFSLLHVKAKRKKVKLMLSTKGAIPKIFESDPKRIKQVLINLGANAIKFTDDGEVRLSVSFDKNECMMHFDVEDTGKGIAKEDQSLLFKPFSQVDSSSTRQQQGAGLGLVLSRNIARGFGGDVKLVWSQVGEGSLFRFSIQTHNIQYDSFIERINTGLDIPPEDDSGDRKSSKLDGLRILVVDDAVENANLFKMFLERAGAMVETANSAPEAIEAVEKERFDIILMDLQMPKMDGYEALDNLRKKGFERPIVALTAHAMAFERERTKQAGFDGHIGKPIRPKDLIESVQRHLVY